MQKYKTTGRGLIKGCIKIKDPDPKCEDPERSKK